MIIDRRKTHVFSFIALAFILPVIFFIGVILRPEYPMVSNQQIQGLVANAIVNIANESAQKAISSQEISSGKITLKTDLFEINNSAILQLKLLSKIQVPEPLIYWQSGNEIPSEITEKSILLGQLSSNTSNAFNLTSEMRNNQGQLILYAQGLKEIQAVFPIKFN